MQAWHSAQLGAPFMTKLGTTLQPRSSLKCVCCRVSGISKCCCGCRGAAGAGLAQCAAGCSRHDQARDYAARENQSQARTLQSSGMSAACCGCRGAAGGSHGAAGRHRHDGPGGPGCQEELLLRRHRGLQVPAASCPRRYPCEPILTLALSLSSPASLMQGSGKLL